MVWKAPKYSALMIIDVQNDFCPGGALAVPEGDQIIPFINKLREHFQTVILTQDWHPPDHHSFASQHIDKEPFNQITLSYGPQTLWPDHCVQNTEGADFHPELARNSDDLLLQKGTDPRIDSYSGFYENDAQSQPRFQDGRTLEQVLHDKDIEQIVLVGLAYDFCVGWNALDAHKLGLKAIIIEEATRAIAMPLEDEETSLKDMQKRLQQSGIMTTNLQKLSQFLSSSTGISS